MDDELLPDFLSEAEDLIEAICDDLKALRAGRGEGRVRREITERIFRRVHTLKGASAGAGIESAAEIAHAFETLLDGVRLGRATLDDAALDAFKSALDHIGESLDAAARGEETMVPRDLVERLRLLSSTLTPPPPPSGSTAEEAIDSLPREVALGEHERQRVREAVSEGASLFIVKVDFGLSDFDERLRALQASLAERGEVVSTIPGVDAAAPERVSFRLIHATRERAGQLRARLKSFGASVREADGGRAQSANQSDTGDGCDASGERDATLPAQTSPPSLHVRVSLEEVDALAALTQGLFADTSAALDLTKRLMPDDAAQSALEPLAARVREGFRELEEKLSGLRVVPLRRTLERAARAGGSIARALGREVEFEMTGGEVRLERTLVEALTGPLLHLLRNAVDHGIEPPDERRRLNKPPRGVVRLGAVTEGQSVVLRVSDDGRGVDIKSVARVAAARGLVGPDEELTDEQALRLILRQGFSTAAEVSSVSGRGVGLDAVAHAVHILGGELRVTSVYGAGTVFEVRFPAAPLRSKTTSD